ncbi:MAG: hypothetical protein RLZZ168_1832, partial [Cyanobacteriota bacterium]
MDSLRRHGVRHIFGYPGGAILPIYDELHKAESRGWLKHILVRHEQGGTHAADAYARATGQVGVCFGTSGPGATNLVTGIATAHMDSVPMVVITGQVPRAAIGTDAFGKSVPTGGFSGLQYLGKDGSGNLRFLTVSDRGPNGEPINVDNDPALERPFLLPDYQARVSEVQFNPTTGKMSVVSTTLLTKPDGSKLTGLPNIPGTDEEPIQIVPADAAQKTGTFTDKGVTYGYKALSYDPLGADLEGVYRLTDGTMWMVDEYRPAVYEFDATGKMLSRYVPAGTAALTAETGDSYGTETLPAHLIKRQANRGFEALAVDETGGYLYAFVQSPLDAVSGTVDTVGPLVRIVKMAIRDMT